MACGVAPVRTPPEDDEVDIARAAVSAALGLPPWVHRQRHAASPLRYGLFKAIVDATGDPDKAPPKWLKNGAPLGVESSIPEGATFRRTRARSLPRWRCC